MSREFTMGIRLNYFDNSFTRGMRSAAQASNGFSNSMRSAETSADGLAAKLSGLAVAIGGIAAGKKAFDWLVGSNADMEQFQNTLTVVMGDAKKATETLDWASKFAAQTPFEIPKIVEATTKLTAYGLNAQKVLGIVGDGAAVMGKDLMQAVEAVADAQTGEVERLKEAFAITKDQIKAQAKLMGLNVVNNKDQITDLTGFNAALFTLMEKRFKGGMDMQSKTFKGMTSNVNDFMGTMGRKLGKPLFDSAKKDLEGLLGTLNALQESGAIDRFITKVHKVGFVIANEMAYSRKLVIGAFTAIWNAAQPIFDYIKKNWESIKPFVQGVGIVLGFVVTGMTILRTVTLAATIAFNLLRLAMLTNPIGWIVLGIGLLVGWFIKMNGGVEGAKNKLLEMWAVVKPFGMAIYNNLVGKGQQTVSWFTKNWPMIKEAVIMSFKQIWAYIGPTVMKISSDIFNAFNAVKTWFQTYWPGIQRAFQLFWAWTGPYIMATLKMIGSIVKNGFMLIWDTIGNVWNMITGIIQIAWGLISGMIGAGMALLVGDWKGAWDSLFKMNENVWAGLSKFFSGLGGLFFDSGKAIMRTLVEGIEAMATAPVDAIKNVLKKVREFLPFSDAKKGPLSNLTYSGGAIMTTLSAGVQMKSGALQDAVGTAFATSGTNIPANAVSAVPASAGRSGGVSVANLIGEIHVTAQPGDTAGDLVNQIISQLYERSKEAVDILTGADKGALVG